MTCFSWHFTERVNGAKLLVKESMAAGMAHSKLMRWVCLSAGYLIARNLVSAGIGAYALTSQYGLDDVPQGATMVLDHITRHLGSSSWDME